MRFHRAVTVVASVLAATFFSVQVLAQQGTATLNGRVTDPGGLAIVGAKLQAVNVDTDVTYSTETNEAGLYGLSGLPPGTYRITVDKSGFQQIVKPGVELHVADIVAINFALNIGSVTQSVTVESGAPLVETTSSSLGGLVNYEKMADLPLNGRNYIDLSLMQPGVARNTNNGGLSGMVGTYYSSNGAPTVSNNFLLDGTPIVNQSGQGVSSIAGTTLGVDGIVEYKVITSAFGAEYGMTMGSQMVMVSKGGTNQFHGDLFEYLRSSALNARNYFDGPKIAEFEKNNFGGSFGGPIKKNKTFFYGVYEGLRENLGFTVNDVVPMASCHGPAGAIVWNGQGTQPVGSIGPCTQLGSNPSGAGTNSVAINAITAPLLSLYLNPGPSATNIATNTYTFPAPDKQGVDYGQIRIDNSFSAADTLFGRYTIDKSNLNTPSASFTAASGVAFPPFRSEGSSQNQFLTLSESHIFSSVLLNTARISFSRTNFESGGVYGNLTGIPVLVAGQAFGALSVGGFSSVGNQSGTTPATHTQNIYSAGDDVFYSRTKHTLKFGMLINRYNSAQDSVLRTSGTVTYSGLAGLLRAIPSSYSAAIPGANFDRDFIYNTFGFYVQDDWHTTSRLTLNMGLRYEFMTTPWELSGKEYALRDYGRDPTMTHGPIMLNKSLLNFSPRLGLAWDVFGDGKTSVRSAFGIYYDVANLGEAFTQNATGTPPLSATTTVSNTSTNAVATFPLVFPQASIGVSGSMVAYNANQPHLMEYNLSLERQLPGHMALSIAYVGSRGVHLWHEQEGNPTIPTFIGSGEVEYWGSNIPNCANIVPSCRVNPYFGSITLDSTNGDSWYNALQLVVNKRLGSGLEFQSAYTYSHSLDTTEGQLSGVDCSASGMDHGDDANFQRKNDFGPSCFDLRHNLRFNLLYHFPSIKTNTFWAKFVNGWWTGSIVSVQGGYPFTPTLSVNRSQSQQFTSAATLFDYANVGTATVAPGQVGPDGHPNSTTKTFIPFNASSVITGKPLQWFNPLMFSLQPMVPCPGNAALTCGTLGDASKGLLRGPGLGTWDFSLVKDTAAPFLGEQGSVQFRAEFFNILNRSNFGMPSGSVFSGTVTDIGAYSEAPLGNAGQITTTATTARQIQFALKLIF